jgi:hypothetical protein
MAFDGYSQAKSSPLFEARYLNRPYAFFHLVLDKACIHSSTRIFDAKMRETLPETPLVVAETC